MYKLLFVPFLFLLFPASAQRIDVQFGSALPSGSFGNNTLSKSDNSFAQNGYTAGIQADYPVYKNMGISAKLNYSSFGFNQSDYQNQLNQTPASATTISVESNGGYNSTSALVGGYMTLGKKRITVDLRLMTGFLTLTDKGLTYTTAYAGQEYKETVFSETDMTVAFGWGLTARYNFGDHTYLCLHMDNVNANTSFRKNNYQSSSTETLSKPYQAYLVSVGLGYTLQ
ncbi:MAG: hypothetical protein V4590_13615 [Bacteroidota bacterium]